MISQQALGLIGGDVRRQAPEGSPASILTSLLGELADHRSQSLMGVARASLRSRTLFEHIIEVIESTERLFLAELIQALAQPEDSRRCVVMGFGNALDQLTERELQVARLAAAGKHDKEIALALGISLNACETHMRNVRGKLDAANGAELKREMDLLDRQRSDEDKFAQVPGEQGQRTIYRQVRALIPARIDGLTTRQGEVARLVGMGLSNKEVAVRLGIHAGTVNAHLRQVYGRLNVRSRAELAYRLAHAQLDQQQEAVQSQVTESSNVARTTAGHRKAPGRCAVRDRRDNRDSDARGEAAVAHGNEITPWASVRAAFDPVTVMPEVV